MPPTEKSGPRERNIWRIEFFRPIPRANYGLVLQTVKNNANCDGMSLPKHRPIGYDLNVGVNHCRYLGKIARRFDTSFLTPAFVYRAYNPSDYPSWVAFGGATPSYTGTVTRIFTPAHRHRIRFFAARKSAWMREFEKCEECFKWKDVHGKWNLNYYLRLKYIWIFFFLKKFKKISYSKNTLEQFQGYRREWNMDKHEIYIK